MKKVKQAIKLNDKTPVYKRYKDPVIPPKIDYNRQSKKQIFDISSSPKDTKEKKKTK
tara:strand:- start:4539 stop:4709 length:171 start_codon:yes stop_codon:yes gene_type:complete